MTALQCAFNFNFPLLFIQNDLLTLKVTSQLHHLSIKCAIHVLHANKFNSNCLRRRPGEEVTEPGLGVFCVMSYILLFFVIFPEVR